MQHTEHVEETGYKPIWQPFVDESLKMAKALRPFALGVVGAGIYLFWRQAQIISKTQRLQGMLAIFDTLESPDVLAARAYIRDVSDNPETLKDFEIEQHVQRMRPALIAFHKVGFLVEGRYAESEPIVAYFWDGVWRAWKKAEGFLGKERQRRGYQTYMEKFDYLFRLSEEYRIKHNIPEPKY